MIRTKPSEIKKNENVPTNGSIFFNIFQTFMTSCPKSVVSRSEEPRTNILPTLLRNKYQYLEDAKEILEDVANISKLFIEFQEYLYK